jgi:uncharacterized protein YegL
MFSRILFLFFLFPFIVFGQTQLILNPGIEDSVNTQPSSGRNKNFWFGYQLTKGWWQAGGSVDYYNSDFSTASRGVRVHKAHTGQGRLGIILGRAQSTNTPASQTGYREYAQTKLTKPMKAGALYSVNFYFVRDKRSVFYAPEIGVHFSNGMISAEYNYSMQASSQVAASDYKSMVNSSKWTLAHGYYRAKGGENYLTLGNFKSETPLYIDDGKFVPAIIRNDFGWFAYYYVDDIYVYEVPDTLSDNYRSLLPKTIDAQPYNNLVFVLDVSASMQKDEKIKKLKEGVDGFISGLDTNEVISIITFDAMPKVLARHVKTSHGREIISAIDSLKTGGGTNVNGAIMKAYSLLDSSYIPGGNNRVILVTDDGFKVSDHTKATIEKHARDKKMGFSTLVFNDVKYHSLKKLCDKNNGTYSNMNNANTSLAINSQAKERKVDDYGPGRNKAYTYLSSRLITIGLLVGLIILAKVK